jgi:predicted alpha-1,6-mannanase (GH76 family)
MGRCRRVLVGLSAIVVIVGIAPSIAFAAAQVCSVYCDTRDPSLARSETFPVAQKVVNGRRIVLHVSDVDAMAWGSIDAGATNDSVWLDRSWDGGSTWDGLLGKAWIPSTWTGTRTLMYNLSDPANHRRGLVRACGDAQGVACTDWVHLPLCVAHCDTSTGGAAGDSEPVPAATLNGRRISLHVDSEGMAWGALGSGRAGDEVWLDRTWNEGASWPDGSSLGRLSVGAGATSTQTTKFNTVDPLGRLYGGAVRACGRATEGPNGSCTAWARPANTRTDAVADALIYAYRPDTAWWPSSWWNSAVALNTVIDYLRKSGSARYTWIVDRTFTVNRVAFPAGVKSSDAIEGDFISRATDDAEWWGLAWIAAYDLTGNSTYLNEAVTIANYVNGLWDNTCGGGVWWNRERTYKNAVTNGLWIKLAASIHNRLPGDSLWLGRATTAWNWFAASGLINASGLVNDGLTSGCQNNGQTVWSYNQGLAIGAAVEVWRATGNAGILTQARRLADAGTTAPQLVQSGLLTESCDPTNTCDDNQKQFKGIFIRYLTELDQATGGAYGGFLRTQSNAVWNADRDSLNRAGERWSGANPNGRDWRTQASALSAVLAG